MSRRPEAQSLLAAIGIVTLVSAAIRGDTPAPQDVEFRMAASIAMPLARQRVTAGVVMCALPPAAEGEPVEDLVRLAGTPVLAACTELNGSLSQRREGGVLHVRTTGEPRHVTELLHRSIYLEPESDVPAIEAVATRIVNAVRGNHSAGRHGSTGATAQSVTLRGGSTTLMQALDDVVRQTPGLVWWVTFTLEEDSLVMVGLVDRHGGSGGEVFQRPKRECVPPCAP